VIKGGDIQKKREYGQSVRRVAGSGPGMAEHGGVRGRESALPEKRKALSRGKADNLPIKLGSDTEEKECNRIKPILCSGDMVKRVIVRRITHFLETKPAFSKGALVERGGRVDVDMWRKHSDQIKKMEGGRSRLRRFLLFKISRGFEIVRSNRSEKRGPLLYSKKEGGSKGKKERFGRYILL